MPLLVGLFIGILAGMLVPFAVKDNPGTFNGMFSGTMLWLPYFDKDIHWSWPVFGLVTLLVWGLLKVARG